MKGVMLLVFVAFCAGLTYARPEGEKYTTKYDNIDLDAIIKNDRLLRNYVDCLLDKKKCTKDGEELKKVLPDAIKTECAKCSEAQQNGAKKIIRHLIDNKKDWWNELEVVYDPDGSYRKKYQDRARKEGFNV